MRVCHYILINSRWRKPLVSTKLRTCGVCRGREGQARSEREHPNSAPQWLWWPTSIYGLGSQVYAHATLIITLCDRYHFHRASVQTRKLRPGEISMRVKAERPDFQLGWAAHLLHPGLPWKTLRDLSKSSLQSSPHFCLEVGSAGSPSHTDSCLHSDLLPNCLAWRQISGTSVPCPFMFIPEMLVILKSEQSPGTLPWSQPQGSSK